MSALRELLSWPARCLSTIFQEERRMSDPFLSPPGTNPPRHTALNRSNNALGWMLGALATAVILGVAFFSMTVPRADRTTTAANPPAVTAAPAPATRAPAPAEETTGRAIERPTPGQELDPPMPPR